MWSYVKGILLGLFLLWLILVLSFAWSDGFVAAVVYGVLMAQTAFNLLQKGTAGTGAYILLLLIISLWLWSFRRNHRLKRAPEKTASGSGFSPNPEDPEQTDENSVTLQTKNSV